MLDSGEVVRGAVAMGVDIYGFIEIQSRSDGRREWAGVVNLHNLVERNYGVFGALFGVRNNDGFIPAFADRGLPADISEETAIESGAGIVKPSWVLWSELAGFDWDQIGSQERVRLMTMDWWREEQHNPSFVIESSLETPTGPQVRRYRKDHPEAGIETLTLIDDHRDDEVAARTAHYTVREVMSSGWQACFDVMRALADTFGGDNVRLVAWFDSE